MTLGFLNFTALPLPFQFCFLEAVPETQNQDCNLSCYIEAVGLEPDLLYKRLVHFTELYSQ